MPEDAALPELPLPTAAVEATAQAAKGAEAPSAEGGVPADILDLVLGRDVAERLLGTARDDLTGLWTSKVWGRVLESDERGCAVAFIDLDGLKAVNDSQGHEAGNALLRRAGEAIRSVTRRTDLACRWGGDEFTVLLRDADEATALAWAARLRDALARHEVRASVGVAVQAEGEALAETARRADRAMYEEKRSRRAEGRPSGGSMPRVAGGQAGALTLPDAWGETDPRRVFCERHKISPARVVQAAASLGATDREVLQTAEWALRKDLDERSNPLRLFTTVLRMKVEDRRLAQVAARYRSTVTAVRNLLRSRQVDVDDVLAVFEDSKAASLGDLVAEAAAARRRAAARS